MSSIPFILRSDTLTTPAIRPSPYIHISSRIFGHRGDRSEHQAADLMLPAPAFARTRAGVFTRKFHRPFRNSTNQPHFQPFGYFNRLLPLFPDLSGSRLHALFWHSLAFSPVAGGRRKGYSCTAGVCCCMRKSRTFPCDLLCASAVVLAVSAFFLRVAAEKQVRPAGILAEQS